MLKKTITYKDFNEEEVKEDFFFNLSEADLLEIEMSYKEGLSVLLPRVMEEQDMPTLLSIFKKFVSGSYGRKSEDGRRFIKNPKLREDFESSGAYSALIMEFVTDDGAFNKFILGIMPRGFLTEKQIEEFSALTEKAAVDVTPKPEPKALTMDEAKLIGMTGKEITDKVVAGEIVIVDE